MAITKDEKYIHSIRFEGETVLQIGSVDAHNDDEWKKGRVETFEIEPAEALLGCEFLSDDYGVLGLRWLKWVRPAAVKLAANDEEAKATVQPGPTDFCSCEEPDLY